jgi:error-prone DNA polymerase
MRACHGDLPFAHLHVASSYSLQCGVSTPADLVTRAVELGQPALALTDRDSVRGAVQFLRAASAAGLSAVMGVDLAVRPQIRSPEHADRYAGNDRNGRTDGYGLQVPRRTPAHGGSWRHQNLPRVVLLAQNRCGWSSLCRLLSVAFTHDPVAVTMTDIADHSEGLIAMVGPQSDVVAALAQRRTDHADAYIQPWRDIFGSRLRMQITSHRHEQGPLSTATAARVFGWAQERGISSLLAHAVRFIDPAQARIADVLDAARHLVPLDIRHRERSNAQGFLAGTDFLLPLAEEIVTAAGSAGVSGSAAARRLLVDAAELAEQCTLHPGDLGIGGVVLPEPELVLGQRAAFDRAQNLEYGDANAALRARCEAGLGRYSGVRARLARARLDAELRTITSLGFATYFLTVAEVIDLARDLKIRVAARGSGAGSLVVHLLGISAVDPMEHGLLMERFLTTLRRELPDIDIDVESARRTQIYDAILQRFGTQRVACVSMPETYRVRHAVRDVGAALGWPPGEIDAIAKAFPRVRARQARAVLAELPELRDSGLGRLVSRGDWEMILELIEGLDGLPRHIAMHPCGVIIADASLHDRTPIEPSAAGYPMTSFDKDDVEHLGFLKLDVLGIRMQSALSHAVDEVVRLGGPQIDLDAVPLDDPRAFALVQSTRTLGCFQIESPGQRELIGKFAPSTFHDLIVDISLFRPGPVKSDMITPFLEARQGWREATYLHEDLQPILAETHGVVVFHEQVLRIIATMTGCSLAEADETRRSMKDTVARDEIETWFIATALGRGYDAVTVNRVWEVLRAFASFGFCKAHAAAFALPTYQSAWFKAHHPAAFLAGVLTHDPGMYPKRLLVDDARSLGITILGLDVLRSDLVYRVEKVPVRKYPPPALTEMPSRSAPAPLLPDGRGWGIRVPLLEVSGMGEREAQAIIAGRPYTSLVDLHDRTGLPLALLERLIRAGALDALYGISSHAVDAHDVNAHAVSESPAHRVTRRDLLLQAADLARRPHRKSKMSSAGVEQLLLPIDGPDDQPIASGLSEMSEAERVQAEMEILGIDVTRHVVDFYEPFLEELAVVRSRNLLACRSRAQILVAGTKILTQTPPVRSGRRVIFLTMDDATGPVDVAFFDDVQDPYAATLFSATMLLVRGIVRRTGPRGVSIRATGCWDLATLYEVWQREGIDAVHDVLMESAPPKPHTVRHPYTLARSEAHSLSSGSPA